MLMRFDYRQKARTALAKMFPLDQLCERKFSNRGEKDTQTRWLYTGSC
jgi:hypothetical protein